MFSRIVRIKILSVALLLCASHVAFAQGASPTKSTGGDKPTVELKELQLDKARMLLSAYHGVPTKQELVEAFPNARDLMMVLATDAETFELHRQRAVAALGYWPDATVYGLYAKMLRAPETSAGLKHQLISHMVRVFGEAGFEEVASYLKHDDVQYRLTAVQAIGMLDSDAAQKLLSVAAETENNEVVLERIARARQQVR